MILLCLGMMISLPIFCSNYIANLSLVSETATFSRYEADRSDLLLYTDSSVIAYQISNYRKKMEDPALFLARCGADQRFQVQYAVYGKEDSVYYGLWSISGEDGTDYLTLAESRIYLRRNFLGASAILAVPLLALVFLLVMSIRVGRHPERYSRRFVRFFINTDYLRTKKYKR